MSFGQVTTGNSVSFTVTVNEQVAVLAAPSIATQVTVVDPTGNSEPDAGVHSTFTPGQLSVAVAWKVTTVLRFSNHGTNPGVN